MIPPVELITTPQDVAKLACRLSDLTKELAAAHAQNEKLVTENLRLVAENERLFRERAKNV